MRTRVLAGLGALALLAVAPVQAVPVTWNLDATFTRTNLHALGPIEVGDTLSASMVLDTDTPAVATGFANGFGYFNVFDSFALSVNGHTLNLGPQLDAARDSNWLGTSNFADHQALQWVNLLFDGDTAYVAEARFEFTDLDAFPVGSLPLTPPSLASARIAEISLYSPVPGNGGLIFIGSAAIGSLNASSVPEPSTLGLLLAATGMLAFARRRRREPVPEAA
jgi:hypothetical protein